MTATVLTTPRRTVRTKKRSIYTIVSSASKYKPPACPSYLFGFVAGKCFDGYNSYQSCCSSNSPY